MPNIWTQNAMAHLLAGVFSNVIVPSSFCPQNHTAAWEHVLLCTSPFSALTTWANLLSKLSRQIQRNSSSNFPSRKMETGEISVWISSSVNRWFCWELPNAQPFSSLFFHSSCGTGAVWKTWHLLNFGVIASGWKSKPAICLSLSDFVLPDMTLIVLCLAGMQMKWCHVQASPKGQKKESLITV